MAFRNKYVFVIVLVFTLLVLTKTYASSDDDDRSSDSCRVLLAQLRFDVSHLLKGKTISASYIDLYRFGGSTTHYRNGIATTTNKRLRAKIALDHKDNLIKYKRSKRAAKLGDSEFFLFPKESSSKLLIYTDESGNLFAQIIESWGGLEEHEINVPIRFLKGDLESYRRGDEVSIQTTQAGAHLASLQFQKSLLQYLAPSGDFLMKEFPKINSKIEILSSADFEAGWARHKGETIRRAQAAIDNFYSFIIDAPKDLPITFVGTQSQMTVTFPESLDISAAFIAKGTD